MLFKITFILCLSAIAIAVGYFFSKTESLVHHPVEREIIFFDPVRCFLISTAVVAAFFLAGRIL